jgi:hypothetical protein
MEFLTAWYAHWGWLWMIVGLLGFVVIEWINS